MKKNLMSVLIMALVFVNVVLSAVIMITLVPAAKQSNELISQVCSAIDLELDSGKVYNMSEVPIEQLDVVNLTGEDVATFTLKDSADGKPHYAIMNVSISFNKEDSDYADKKALVEGREALLQEIISSTFLNYTFEEVKTADGQEKIRDEMLEKIQELFDTDCIVAVNFSNPNYQ